MSVIIKDMPGRIWER